MISKNERRKRILFLIDCFISFISERKVALVARRKFAPMSFILILIFASCLSHHCSGYQHAPLRYRSQIISGNDVKIRNINQLHSFESKKNFSSVRLHSKVEEKAGGKVEDLVEEEIKEPSAFDQVASKGLAGVLAIAAAEA